jgi:hypothetical protein
MSGQVPPSSHGSGSPQPINPYEPSRAAALPPPGQPAAAASEFQFHSRLDWSDRRALLRSVGPNRVAAVCSGVLWIKALFDYGQGWANSLTGSEPIFTDAIGILAIPLLGVLWVLQGLLGLYLCWLGWKYAERLQAAAGGRTRSWRDWSQLHLRTARLSAAALMLGLMVEAGNWLIDRWDAAAAL